MGANRINPILGTCEGYPPDAMIINPYAFAAAPSGGVDWTNLVAYWPMDEANGTRTDDVSSLTLTESAASVGSASVTGMAFTAAADFEKDDNKYLLNNGGAAALHTNAWTCCAWVKPESLVDFARIADSSNSNTFEMVYRSSSIIRLSCVGVNTDYSFGMSAGNWYFVCFGYDNTANKQFVKINATARAETTNNNSYNTSASIIEFGKGSSAATNWDGLIGPVAWFSELLSNTRIAELYNSGTGVTYP